MVDRGKLVLLLFIVAFLGCASDQKIFDPTGRCLFTPKDSGVKPVANVRESEMSTNTVGSEGVTGSPWAPSASDSKTQLTRTATIASGLTTWSTQRPNGGVLFPQTLPGTGPLVVLEPKTTVAPIDTEIVLVGSYVGANNQYLQVQEKLEWDLDGVGRFTTNNPNPCVLTDYHTKKTSDRFLATETTNKLWRIHRGTPTPLDDISVLKGQSWTSVRSGQEGTTTVSILASNIDNWQYRTASAQIHWVDAAIMFPKSGVSTLQQQQMLSTSVVRKSDPAQGRTGWIVRYEVISGPQAGFGDQFAHSIEAVTDHTGQSNVYLRQAEPTAGTNQVLVKIIRPATVNSDQVVVAEKTISQSWIAGAFFKAEAKGPPQLKLGSKGIWQVNVTNLTGTAQNATVRMAIPVGTQLVSTTPTGSLSGNIVTWLLDGVPARGVAPIQVELLVNAVTPINLHLEVDQRKTATGQHPSTVITPGLSPTTSPPISGSPAATIPSLPSGPSLPVSPSPAPAPTLSKIDFNFLAPFPKTVNQNKPFDIVFGISNPGNRQVSQMVPSCQFSQGIAIMNGQSEMPQKTIGFNALGPNEQGKTFPLTFMPKEVGTQKITLVLRDGTGAVLTEYNADVQVVPAASAAAPIGGGTSTAPLPIPIPAPLPTPLPTTSNLTVTIRTVPVDQPFWMGKTVLFEVDIVNNNNYEVSGLQLSCTPNENRLINAWKLVSSVPPGAQAAGSSGSYLLGLPSLAAGQKMTASMTFMPEQVVTNGNFIATILSGNSGNVVATKSMIYAIAQERVQRPVTESLPEQNNESAP